MALIELDDFAFTYGQGADPVVGPLSVCVEEGAFCLVTGLTGSGKSTLLRALKPELSPRGAYGGNVRVCGVDLVRDGVQTGALDQEFSARHIGYVEQDPDAQIVCDTVWHEMAFALENLGVDADVMRRRVAEVANFLGIVEWMPRRTDELSGGQKQLLNLAAALVLRPPLILLDEPTAQLDPAARRQFASLLASIWRELGLTVVVATHLPEEFAAFATQRIELAPIGDLAPLVARTLKNVTPCLASCHIQLRDVFVRHGADGPWVLRGLDLEVRAGCVHAVVGGNGSGKTTLLRTVAGDMKPRRGKVVNRLAGAQAYLPQDPKAVFVCDTVADELREWQARAGYADAEVMATLNRFGLAGKEPRHPYDLSGGERQNLALAKMLLTRPKLLLLDEPTKGLDAVACARVVRELRRIADGGAAVVLATHDLDVVAACADEATLLFDGQAASTQPVPGFFEDNLVWRPHEASRLYGALA